jgi:hypothetical protein
MTRQDTTEKKRREEKRWGTGFISSRVFHPCVEDNCSVIIYNPQPTSGKNNSSKRVKKEQSRRLAWDKKRQESWSIFGTPPIIDQGQKIAATQKSRTIIWVPTNDNVLYMGEHSQLKYNEAEASSLCKHAS